MFTDRTQFHSLACVSLRARAAKTEKRVYPSVNVSTLTSRSPGTCQNLRFSLRGVKGQTNNAEGQGGPADESSRLDADDIYTRLLDTRMRYMCIYACAVLLIGGRAGLVVSYRSRSQGATLLDSTRESILALRYNFWRLQGTQSSRGKPVLNLHIIWLFRLFSRHISRTQSFQQNRHIIFHALVALKLLVSLISRLVACSARIVVDRPTDRQTNKQTDTQTKYCNPRCACAPRVN